MKKRALTMKKAGAFLLAVALAVTVLQVPTEVQAAPSNKKVTKAYVAYLKKQVANCKYEDDITYNLYDFNKDGVNELVVCDGGGARPYYDVYTYRNKKVVSLVNDVNGIGYINGKKYIVTYGSGGAIAGYDYTVYKMKKNKLKKVNKYAYAQGVYKRNGKRIEESEFDAFVKTVVTDLGISQEVPKKYFSPKELGFSVYGKSGELHTSIERATKKKVFYYNYKIGEASVIAEQSEQQSAKITSKTKFYYGDLNHLFSGNLEGDSMDNKKWVCEISKKQFLEKMKLYSGGKGQITVKNGKVTKVIIHIQVAG